MDPADTKELPREMSAADVAEETKADVEAVEASFVMLRVRVDRNL